MVCVENAELELIWRKRYELARHAESSGLFEVSQANESHVFTLRQHRAKQAQAASAILMHRKHCSICQPGQPAFEAPRLAS